MHVSRTTELRRVTSLREHLESIATANLVPCDACKSAAVNYAFADYEVFRQYQCILM